MKNLIIYVFFLLSLNALQGQELKFKNFQPKWIHNSIVPNVVDEYKYVLPSLIDNNDLYLTSATTTDYYNGFLLEKLNLQTGQLLWSYDYYPLEHFDREYPQTPFINSDGDLSMAFFREQNKFNDVLWWNSSFANRVFDRVSGNLIRSHFNDSLSTRLHMPLDYFLVDFSKRKAVILPKEDNYQYLIGNSYLQATVFNDDGEMVDSIVSKPKFPLWQNHPKSQFIFNGKQIIQHHAVANLQDHINASYFHYVDILNFDLSLSKRLDITKFMIPDRLQDIVYADLTHFIIETNNYTVDELDNRHIISRTFYLFDYNERLLKRVKIDWEDTPYNTYAISKVRNTDEILLIHGKMDMVSGIQKIKIMSSDGFDELIVLKALEGNSTGDRVNIQQIQQTKNNDLLISFSHNLSGTVTMLIEAMDLGLTSANDDIIKSNWINMYPNPATDFVIFQCDDSLNPSTILIKNTLGQTINHLDYKSHLELNILEKGLYYLSILDENGHLIDTKKLILNK